MADLQGNRRCTHQKVPIVTLCPHIVILKFALCISRSLVKSALTAPQRRVQCDEPSRQHSWKCPYIKNGLGASSKMKTNKQIIKQTKNLSSIASRIRLPCKELVSNMIWTNLASICIWFSLSSTLLTMSMSVRTIAA